MRTRTARISSNYYAIKVYFIYGTYPAYFNYQIVLGEIQYSFTTSINIALFYTLEERNKAEIFLNKNLKKLDVKYFEFENV
jgi:hypothetical protein